jgi:hypothetical protein
MKQYQAPAFAGVIVLALFAGLLSYSFAYHGASASFSDLYDHGIKYGTPVFDEIVAIARHNVAWVGILLGFTNVLALMGWAFCLLNCPHSGVQRNDPARTLDRRHVANGA